ALHIDSFYCESESLSSLYTLRLATAFSSCIRELFSFRSSSTKNRDGISSAIAYPIRLHIDCAHGVGALVFAKLNGYLIETGCPLNFCLHNTLTERKELLNHRCGADYIKVCLLSNCKGH
ncbi:unnamed protein product, partial [Protopolystoma xenopodis]